MHSIQKQIRPCEMQEYWYAALEMTRNLGIRYLWIDSICIVQDDPEEMASLTSTLLDIYSSCKLTICEVGEKIVGCHVDTSVLMQPFSFFLNWSQPMYAVSCARRLQKPCWNLARAWTQQDLTLSYDAALQSLSAFLHNDCEGDSNNDDFELLR